jgi:hypothetical protein
VASANRTWSLALSEEHNLGRVFNKVLGNDGKSRKVGKFHEALHNLYFSPNIIRVEDEMGVTYSTLWEIRNKLRNVVGKPKGKTSL